MKRIISFFVVCMLLCVNVFAENNYTTINMSEFANVDNFAEGLCAVQDKTTSRWGFVDINKNWVISPQYKSASYFKNGVCAVNTVDGETALINHNGNIVFKTGYNNNVTSETFFLEKHGKNLIVWEDMNMYIKRYSITLTDENYNVIIPNDVSLRSFITTTDESPEVSHTLFWESNQNGVYNYKGVNITSKLERENITISDDMIANNKYIVGRADSKVKIFDIDGNKVAEFSNDTSDKVILRNDFIICNNKVFNIQGNKIVFDGQNIDVQDIVTYYNKFFTVKKKNGTSALYDKNGNALVDFGKWDKIIPLSTSNYIIVSANNKYGLSDYSGNLIFALDNINGYASNSGKYAVLRKDRDNDINIEPTTLKTYNSIPNDFYMGYKYHRSGNKIIDNKFNVVYNDNGVGNYLSVNGLDNNGVTRIRYSGTPATYGFVIFEDSGIKVKLDNTRLEFDVLPIIQNGRTLVPMRAIFEALGADVAWDGETQTITAKNKDITIQMQIGNNTLIKNGQSTQMDVSPQLLDGRTMVPVRAVSDSFNVTVDWDNYTQTVSLYTN